MIGDGPSRQEAVAVKLAKLRSLLEARGYDAAVLVRRRTLAWLTDGADTHVVDASEDGVATLVVSAEAACLISAVNEAGRLREEELADTGLDVREVPWEQPEALAAAVAAAASGRRRGSLRIADDAVLEADLRRLRARLTPAEQDRLARLGETASRAMTATFHEARAGMTEREVAATLVLHLARAGVAAPVTLAAADGRIARYRHPIPTTTRIERSLMLVVAAEHRGLNVAMTRFGWLAGTPNDEWHRRTAAARAIEATMHRATQPGTTLGAVFAAGVAAYADAGFPDEWRLHHQGGTIAYGAREIIGTPAEPELVERGMAFAWNPSITGTKVEDTLLLRTDGSRSLVTRDSDWPTDPQGCPAPWLGKA